MRTVHSRNPPRRARRQIRDIQSQRSSALVVCEERDARSIGRHTRKRREVRNITHARRLGHTRRTGSKTIAQSQRVVAFGCDPVPPFLRQALAAEEIADACAARNDRSKAACASRHPGGRGFDPVSVGKVIEEQAAEHIVTVERPGARIRFRLVQVRAVRLEHSGPQRLGESRAAHSTSVGEPRLVERGEPLDQVAAVEEVREGQVAAAEHPSQHAPPATRLIEMEHVGELRV